VAKKLPSFAGKIDIIHAWPLAALETIKAARQLGIPVALERCNAHTGFAYEVVRQECDRLGVPLPSDHEHAFNEAILRREEDEYRLADALLCPSEFVVKTFVDAGFDANKLTRFYYGVDETIYFPKPPPTTPQRDGLTMLFVGVCAVRKGLHFALEAWRRSPASESGRFLIAGDFLPDYKARLEPLLAHPSIEVLGHRSDIPALMRESHVCVLPSIEEGFGLVCTEAMASGCVPLVSEACTNLCRHGENSLVHAVGDVDALTQHINMLNADRSELDRLRTASLATIPSITWAAAGRSLVRAYSSIVSANRLSY
jgi:glycosyltransferase involved in cell wall biosynthesis